MILCYLLTHFTLTTVIVSLNSEPSTPLSVFTVLSSSLVLFSDQGPDGLPMPGCWQKVRQLQFSSVIKPEQNIKTKSV